MNKYILIILITISLLSIIKNADTCTTYTTEATCNKGTNCEWKATGKCKGDSGTTCSSVTVQETCPNTQYTGTINCVYTAESSTGACAAVTGATTSPTCNGNTRSTCEAINECEWTPQTPASCGPNNACTSKAGSQSTCEGSTYSGNANCVWEVGTCATKATNNNNNNNNDGDDDSSFGLKLSGLIYFILALF